MNSKEVNAPFLNQFVTPDSKQLFLLNGEFFFSGTRLASDDRLLCRSGRARRRCRAARARATCLLARPVHGRRVHSVLCRHCLDGSFDCLSLHCFLRRFAIAGLGVCSRPHCADRFAQPRPHRVRLTSLFASACFVAPHTRPALRCVVLLWSRWLAPFASSRSICSCTGA